MPAEHELGCECDLCFHHHPPPARSENEPAEHEDYCVCAACSVADLLANPKVKKFLEDRAREQFAMSVLQGYLSSGHESPTLELARMCWDLADAMLKERNK